MEFRFERNLGSLGLRRLLEYRGRCFDASRELQQDARGDYRLLSGDEQKRVDDLLNEADRCGRHLAQMLKDGGHEDAAAAAEAAQRQAEVLYSRSDF